MDHFDLAQSFIECCERRDPIEEITSAFQTSLERLGFGHFACCSHADPMNPPPTAVMAHNYPDVWVHVFSEMKFYDIDPVLLRAEQSAFPFFWNDPTFRSQLTNQQTKILEAGGTFGIEDGYTVPIRLSWMPGALRGSCSLVPDGHSIDARSYYLAQLLATHFYAAASGAHLPPNDPAPIALTRRERACLELVARGESDWDIGQLLGINEGTVRRHVANVKRRLSVATRPHAIVRAMTTRQISFGDIVRAAPEQGEES